MNLQTVCLVCTGLFGVFPQPIVPGRVARSRAIEWEDPQDRDTLTHAHDVNGLTVIHRFAAESEVVAVNLYLLGGARQVTDSTAGIEPLLLHASERGTLRYPGRAARTALAKTGGWIEVEAEADWTVFGMRARRETFDSTWAVFADRVINPTLDARAVEIERNKMIAFARARQTDPDEAVRSIALRTALYDHPYGLDVRGTEASLSRIGLHHLKAYMAEHLVKSRIVLVVVGNITFEQIQSAVEGTLGQLPVGDYVWEMPPVWIGDEPSVTVAHRGIPTNYILGYFGGPLASSDDHAAFRVAVAMLSWLISYVASEEGLTYAGHALFFDQAVSGGAVYFSTGLPQDCIDLTNDAIRMLKSFTLQRAVMRDYARSALLSYYMQSETSAEQAGIIGRAFLYRGVLATPDEHVDAFMGVSGSNVRSAANKYFKNIQYAMLGDTTGVPREAMTKY